MTAPWNKKKAQVFGEAKKAEAKRAKTRRKQERLEKAAYLLGLTSMIRWRSLTWNWHKDITQSQLVDAVTNAFTDAEIKGLIVYLGGEPVKKSTTQKSANKEDQSLELLRLWLGGKTYPKLPTRKKTGSAIHNGKTFLQKFPKWKPGDDSEAIYPAHMLESDSEDEDDGSAPMVFPPKMNRKYV